jgi:predicted outer membrane repeat protein
MPRAYPNPWFWNVLLLLLIGALGSEPAAAQTILRVDRTAPTGGDGTSWTTAFNDLVLALDSAAGTPGPVEIWVAQNTYKPDRGTEDITRSFVLTGYLTLLGGFIGDEVSADQRDPAANTTILSGDLWGNDWPNYGNRWDNSLHIVTVSDSASPKVIDGFTLRGGNADFEGSDLLGGGAVYVERADLELRGCFFTENMSGSTMPGVGNFGAAVYVKYSGTVVIDDCRFFHNRANGGGALGAANRHEGPVDLIITDSVFEDNSVLTQHGGAIYFTGRFLSIEGCEFIDNHGGYGGVITGILAEKVTILDSNFSGSVAQSETSVLWLDRADNYGTSPVIVERCSFTDGWTGGGTRGGTIYLKSTVIHMSHCEIRNNYHLRVDPFFGSFEGAGVIFVENGLGHRFINCLVADNFGGKSGGVIVSNAQAEFVNCTIVNNHTAALTPWATGLSGFGSNFTVDNTILWGNRFFNGENNNLPGIGGEEAQLSKENSVLAVSHSDVEGWSGELGGVGNLGRDPLFVDEVNGDLHVFAGSPVIDVGGNAALPEDLLQDLDGNPRVSDGDGDQNSVVDMGAYEFPGSVSGVVSDNRIDEAGLFLAIHRETGGLSIGYGLPREANVELAVFDIRGRRLRVLSQGRSAPGGHSVSWDEKDAAGMRVASGIYIVHLTADTVALSRRVVIVR